MRKQKRELARNNMIAAGINGSEIKRRFKSLWRKYAYAPRPAPKTTTTVRPWRRKLWPQLRPQRRA